MGKKVTKAEKEKRVSVIMQLICNGLGYNEICQYVSSKLDWDVSTRTISRYIRVASSYFIEKANIDRDKEIGKAIERLEHLLKNAMSIKDLRFALQIMQEMNKLLGLYEAVKVNMEHSGEVELIIDVEE